MDVPIPLARLDIEKQDSDEPAVETPTSIQDEEVQEPKAEPQPVQHSLQSRDPVQDGDDNEARIELTDDIEAELDHQASIRDVRREENSQQAASGSTKAAIRSHRNFPDPSYPSFTLPIARRRKREPGIEYIDWHEDDRQNPFHWKKRRKRTLLVVGFFFALTTIMNASSYTMAEKGATSDFGASGLAYTSGTTTFLVAVAFAPMVLAPISEVFGRKYVLIISATIFVVTYLPQALSPNIASIILTRFFQGLAASTGSTLVAGTIADVYQAAERGRFVMLFSLVVFLGQALGPLIAGFISTYSDWRWIWWFQGILGLVSLISMIILLEEPRGIVLLSRRARGLTKVGDGQVYRTSSDDERASLSVMIRFSFIRPFKFLFGEVIVMALSAFTGMAWATLSLFIGSIKMVFEEQYGYTDAQVGLVYLAIGLGGLVGYFGNFFQERLYDAETKRCHGKAAPETRLYLAASVGAFLFPASLFFFAWTARPWISPAAPIVALVLLSASIYWIHVSVISYIADCFERYTSSGLAAEYFTRVLLAAFFPLFLSKMYENLGPPIASSVLGSIAAVLSLCPFLLIRFGEKLRRKSRIVKQLEQDELDLMNKDLELSG